MKYNEMVYWNQNKYGNALILKKKIMQSLFIIMCLCTPGTNWMIIFANKIKDIKLRY